MKKFLLSIFLIIICNFIKAQLDTEHWFAPMYDGQSNSAPFQYLHLSTDNPESFVVSVFSGNQLIDQVSIKKGSPQYISIPREYIILETYESISLFTPINKGLHIKGDHRFFANLRFGVINHAEIITSKGKAGLGKEFFTVMAPNQQDSNVTQGFTTSIIATEDNTTITIPKFKKELLFTDGIQRDSLTFTLNKGESYIIDGRSLSKNNLDGFIGTKILSDKPISITNGNFNGQYIIGTTPEDGSDILMDQSVPTDKLGNEFGVIKGYGVITKDGNGMERAVIVATKNETEVFINGNTTPIVTLNEGDYFFVPDTFYINRGNDHYNIHIKTNKNVYVYQVLGGVETGMSTIATGGMNYIPPLNCYLPRKIDEIGHLNSIGGRFRTAKLNIISERGANVLINGKPIDPYYGPFPLANNSWETYSVHNLSGNITIESNKAITAGIAAGDGGAEGYGGYFAGFSSIPLITKKSGECIPDVILELPEGFDMYIWEKKNDDGTYSKVSEGSHIFQPTEIGYYRAKIQQGTCDVAITQDFKLLNCVTYTSTTYSICKEEIIKTAFSLNRTPIDTQSITILQQPSKGTIVIDRNTQSLKYIANPSAGGHDFFSYSFCSNGINVECEEVKVNLIINTIPIVISEINGCLLNNNQIIYNLKDLKVTGGQYIYRNQFFKNLNDAENNANEITENLDQYITSESKIYIKVSSENGCEEIVEVPLQHYPLPEMNTDRYKVCDTLFEGKVTINLSDLKTIFLKNSQEFPIVKYYPTQQDAISGNSVFSQNSIQITGITTIYMSVESPNLCETKIFPIILDISDKINLKSLQESIEICDDDLDGFKNIEDLQLFKNLFTDDTTVNVKFYSSKQDAINQVNDVNSDSIDTNGKTYYIRANKNGICSNVAELKINIKIPKSTELLQDQIICPDSTTILDAGEGFSYYKWSNGEEGSSVTKIRVAKGDYWVDLTYNNCTYRQFVRITNSEQPEITSIEIKGNEAFIQVENGHLPYQYSLDGIHWQIESTFKNLSRGIHTVYVKGNDNCSIVSKEFLIINLINVITPNGDGFNDVLDYSDLRIKKEVSIQIFDRYGTPMYQSKGNNYIWDGKINGRSIQSNTYWYVLKWIEPDTNLPVTYSNWILIKNRD